MYAEFELVKKLSSYFVDLEQSKTPFGEIPWFLGCHATPMITFFFVSPCYLQNALPCQWSSSDLPKCYGFERAFFTRRYFLPYTSYCCFQGFPGSRQLNLKASRASCWSPKHSPGPTICLNHNNPQKRYSGRFYLRVMASQQMKKLSLAGFELFSQ